MSRKIDLTGQQFGRLSVVRESATRKGGKICWECLCACGNQTVVRGGDLRNGKTKSCGCVTGIKMIGKKFGRLSVIGESPTRKDGQVCWDCLCDCGTKLLTIRGSSLRRGDTKSCGCLQREGAKSRGHARHLRLGESSFNKLYHNYRNHAKARGRSFSLSKELVGLLTKQDCFYCGIKPSQVSYSPKHYGEYTYNGIDRVDNSKGYTPDNVVTCCKTCNYAKHAKTQEEFLAWMDRLVEHRRGINVQT